MKTASKVLRCIRHDLTQERTPELHELRAYAELGLYYVVIRQDPDLSTDGLVDLLSILRDLLGDFRDATSASRDIQRAYADAIHRAAERVREVSAWPKRYPGTLRDLVGALDALIVEIRAKGSIPPADVQRTQRLTNQRNAGLNPVCHIRDQGRQRHARRAKAVV